MAREDLGAAGPLSDAGLIARVRAGDGDAYGALYERHVGAARRLALQLTGSFADADDVVADTFARILSTIQRGRGPVSAFRPYLLTAIRRAAADRYRGRRAEVPMPAADLPDEGELAADPAVAALERALIVRAFRSLPERWAAVLWHTEVEGASPAEVARLLGLSPNGVAALRHRAREGLRQAYLRLYLPTVKREECRVVARKLAAHVRGTVSERDSRNVESHLKECADCRNARAELTGVNDSLRGSLAPVILGGAAAAYVSAAAGAPAKGLVGAISAWFRGLLRHWLVAVSAAAAAVAVIALTVGPPNARRAPPRAGAPGGGGSAPGTATLPGRQPASSALRVTATPAVSTPSSPPATASGPAPTLNVQVAVSGPLNLGLVAVVDVRVSNSGAAPTGGVMARITLPPGVSLLGLLGSQGPWTCQPGSAVTTCAGGPLDPGVTASVSARILVVSLAGCDTPISAVVLGGGLSAAGRSASSAPC